MNFFLLRNASDYYFKIKLKFYLSLYLVALLSLFLSNVAQADLTVGIINQVDELESVSELPPADSEAWQASHLPYKYSGADGRNVADLKYVWFRFNLEGEEPLSLYIAHYYFNVAIFLNGKAIGGSLARDDQQAVGLVYPIFLDTSSNWHTQGKNTVHIRLSFGAPTTLISEVHVAKAALLNRIWKHKVTQQMTVSLSSVIICILLAIFTFGLWLKRKQDIPYLIFALLAGSWCIPMLYVLLPYSPIEHGTWLTLAYLGIDFSFLSLFIYINRIFNFGFNKTEKLLFYKSFISTVLVLLVDIEHIPILFLWVYFFNILGLVFIFIKSCFELLIKKNKDVIWLVISFLILIIILGHDLYIFIESSVGEGIIKSIPYFQIGFPVVLLILFSNLIKRFVDALNESEELNSQLENRVKRSAEALELSYKENREIELQNAANQEKQRIYQDLHDDVGSKLVSIIHSKGKDNSQDIARSALVSLRESVANSKNISESLSELIESIIDEAEIRCTSSSLTFESTQDNFEGIEFNADINRHISRIIREAVTNIIKHAQAKQVIFKFEKFESGIGITVKDDGLGINPSAEFGSGIENMRHRAKVIGASIEWSLAEPSGDKDKGCQMVLKYFC